MTIEDINNIAARTRDYNFHSHTQFCDGHASMEEMARAAEGIGMAFYGFSPHSPLCIESPCNMSRDDVQPYIDEADRLDEVFINEGKRIKLLKGMEIDRISHEWAPHIDYFQQLPLDYRIGSVHFVVSQDGEPVDCDGSFARFEKNLKERFHGDLRYVVEKYYESLLSMIEEGGFEILAHPDKIAANASDADAKIEAQGWYEALLDDVVRLSAEKGIVVEINTKAIRDRNRIFPAERWIGKFIAAGIPLIVNSDAHYPDKIQLGRAEAFDILDSLITK